MGSLDSSAVIIKGKTRLHTYLVNYMEEKRSIGYVVNYILFEEGCTIGGNHIVVGDALILCMWDPSNC